MKEEAKLMAPEWKTMLHWEEGKTLVLQKWSPWENICYSVYAKKTCYIKCSCKKDEKMKQKKEHSRYKEQQAQKSPKPAS